MKKFVFSLLFFLVGCGSSGNNGDLSNGPVPYAQPGNTAVSIPETIFPCTNFSKTITAEQFAACVARCDQQMTTDVNPRWGLNIRCVVSTNPLENNKPGIELVDRETPPQGYTDGVHGHVAYGERSKLVWQADMSHVIINLATPGVLAAQDLESHDYHIDNDGNYVEAPPWELCVFTFPNHHGLGGTYYDWKHKPAYDILGILAYP